MSFDKKQFRDLIERILEAWDPNLYSEAAVNLLLGTAAQESHFGTYLRQLGGGPAIGVFQMEPATFNWLRETYSKKYSFVIGRTAEEMEWDLRLAIMMARLRYWFVPEPLPHPDSIAGLAAYWKKHYNTELGTGTVNEFVTNYHKYVL